MPATDHLPRTLGPYRLQDRLGEGGMGVVHLARDREGRPVAVKVLHPVGTDGANARRRLAREVETMRRVRSPYVAEVLDADVTGEYPYIVTRFVAGPTLDEMVRARGPLPGPGLRRLAYGIAEALAAIHAAGVVHRDLKPGNVMMTEDRPIVIDFGIAQAGDATRLTQTGLVMGTPGYLAPEVIEGQSSSPASDVHSWGSTMAFAATGHLPFGAGSYETIFYRIVSGRADLTGVPASLVPLISAALARDPSHRPSASWLSDQVSALDMSASGTPRTAVYTGAPFPPASTPYEPAPYQAAAYEPAPYQAAAQEAARGMAAPGMAAPGMAAPGMAAPGMAALGGKAQSASAAPRAPYVPPRAPKQAARDVADLLPPVDYEPAPRGRRARQAASAPQAPNVGWGLQPPAGGYPQPAGGTQPGPWGPDGPRPAILPAPLAPPGLSSRASEASGPSAPAAPSAGQSRPQASPATAAGLALMVVAVALTLALPVAGLLASLAVITLLRAADQAQSKLAVRRSVRGPRPSDPLVVLVTAPLSVARAVLAEMLMAPFAVMVAAAAYGLAVVLTHTTNMPQAGAYAAAAAVAWYGLGPGSGRPRRQLNRMAGAVARTRMSAAATALAVWALAAGAVLFASSQAPYYWPAVAPHLPGLPGLPGLLTAAWHWLLRTTHA